MTVNTFNFGRKYFLPKVKEETVEDGKKAEEHHVDKQGNENGDSELAHDHENEERGKLGRVKMPVAEKIIKTMSRW